jgi:hypothetical protein
MWIFNAYCVLCAIESGGLFLVSHGDRRRDRQRGEPLRASTASATPPALGSEAVWSLTPADVGPILGSWAYHAVQDATWLEFRLTQRVPSRRVSDPY